ncbi:MAG: KUP/HAK/KT family potassium transporter [bacterium]
MIKHKKGTVLLVLGALGVVYGDIGTSPLYALGAAFNIKNHHLLPNSNNVFGIISLILWSIFLVVTVKYVSFIMKADNEGEGGIMALVALVKRHIGTKRLRFGLILIGVIGVSLFYGDGIITPAISVMSAVEGLRVVAPNMAPLVIPIVIILLTVLFFIQKFGTAVVGKLFGPVMLVWFLTIASGGIYQIYHYPSSLIALSPITALHFIGSSPIAAFISMTAVVLAITGVEALYADLGHFGISPIRRAWFFIVFPSLVLCYVGQGALIINGNSGTNDLLIKLFPSQFQFPVLILSAVATIIASQAVISGIFSLTRQAIQLDFLPKMKIKHTSYSEIGQIYLPLINLLMYIAVIFLVIVFGSSTRLANAYGIAVSGTIAIDTILFISVIQYIFKDALLYYMASLLIFIPIDFIFVSSNLQKVLEGGIYPLLIGLITFTIIRTWTNGERIMAQKRDDMEETFESFMGYIRATKQRIERTIGSAIYLTEFTDNVPIALQNNTRQFQVIPKNLVIVSIKTSSHAHIPPIKRALVDDLGYNDGISHINLYYGYKDQINLPQTLKSIMNLSPELKFNPNKSIYYVSLDKPVISKSHNMSKWRKSLYLFMAQNELSDSDFYHLPIDRTEEFTTLISL